MDTGAESQAEVNFAPGTRAPTVDERKARAVEMLAANRDKWNSLPKEVRAARRAEKKAAAAAKKAAKAAKQAARAEEEASPSAPATVRSVRAQTTTLPSEPGPAATAVTFDAPRTALLGKLQGLIDLVAALPGLDEGASYIQVSRVKPTVYQGVSCSGVLIPIKYALDDGEFFQRYGGGEYVLRGYNYQENGRPRPATDPVPYKLPGAPILVMPDDEDEEPQMRPNHQQNGGPPRRGFPVTPQQASAEAEMHDRNLTHEETMDERNERRAREKEERRRASEREESRAQLDREKMLLEAKDREADRLAAAHERELELVQGRQSNVSEMAELLKVIRPDDGGRAAQQHAQEIKQLAAGHRDEMVRLTEQHRGEIQRLTEQHQAVLQRLEEQNRHDRERADTLVRETERRANEQIREAQRAADGRVGDAQNLARSQYDDLKSRGEERLRDNETQWQRRFDDLKDAHARELRQKDSEITLMRTNLEGNQQVILQTKDNEIKRLQHELRMSKDEAEKNKDWVSKMKEAGETAEALGYVKPEDAGGGDGEGDDLKTTAMKAGMQALTRLPEMIQAGANAFAQIRNPGGAPERGGGRPGQVRSNMRTLPRSHGAPPQLGAAPTQFTFATEGGSDYVPPPGAVPPQQAPMYAQYAQPDPPPAVTAPQPAFEQQQFEFQPNPAAEPVAALPQPQAAIVTAPQQAAPQPPAGQSVAPPPPSAAPAPIQAEPLSAQAEAILTQLLPELTRHFDDKAPAEAVAAGIIQANSVEMVQFALTQANLNQVLTFIQANPDFAKLASRTGQRFIRTVWRTAEHLTQNPHLLQQLAQPEGA